MAEAIAFSIVSNLMTKLGAVAFKEISSVYGVEDELGKLKYTLSTIEAALLDADQRKEKSHLMQDWIRKLNDAVYDADDLLDAFATKALQRQLNADGRKVREFFSSSNQLAFRYKLGHSIKEIRERFDEIAANMSKFNFTERLTIQASVDHNDRETISFVSTSDIIGREKDKEEILKLIMSSTRSNEENVTVITIVGMGGLGKTTLTQLVYNDEKVVEYFGLRLWVCVSEDFEKKLLVRKILQSLTNSNEVGDLEWEQLQIRLRENLDGKRFLLVLDDIWNEIPHKWELVKNLLMCGAKGSKIVVTTRSRKVASVMGTENPYILKGLSDEQSWTLFERVAFDGHETVHSNLVLIGKEIIEKCKGIPLAIRSLASVMQSKTQESEWLSIRNSDVWSLCQDDDILPILKLSYDYLPIHLRQCFAYCSIFPKDHEIQKELLIQIWMAQGYIQSSNSIQCLEDIGDQYFRNLLSRSFFQDAKVNDYNEVISCQMHDLIHDLAIRVAGSDCAIAETYEDNISNRVHHVSIVHHLEEFPGQMLKAKGLRTFLATCDYNNFYSHQASRSTFMSSNFRCLRVLDVHRCGVEEVPNSFGKLQHLRYFDLSYNDMKSLPDSICKLVNLQTLKLSSCYYLERLPEGITKLINLRYLMIDACGNLNHMPSGMGKLTSLRRLHKFVVGGNNNSSVQLSELNGLNELRRDILIEGLENVRDGESESKEANLKAKQYLHCLRLKWKRGIVGEDSSKFDDQDILLESLQPHSELKELTIEGYSGQRLPSWMIISLPFVKVLNLRRMRRVEYQLIEDNNLNLATKSSSSSSSLFFPSLEELCIEDSKLLNPPNETHRF